MLNPLSYIRLHRKYEGFIKNNLPVTSVMYKTLSELEDFDDEKAVYIAGGDQIWNSFHPCGRDDAYKLTFVKGRKKIAYGTSMGRNSFTTDELNVVAEKIKDFYSIGLREQSTVSMLQPFTPVSIYHAADPVLLLEKSHYLPFIGKEGLIKEPYMLMYLADKSIVLDKIVDKVSNDRNLKIAHVCGSNKKCRCDYFLKTTGPTDLLNLIYYLLILV